VKRLNELNSLQEEKVNDISRFEDLQDKQKLIQTEQSNRASLEEEKKGSAIQTAEVNLVFKGINKSGMQTPKSDI
jgi:hypothetical protein